MGTDPDDSITIRPSQPFDFGQSLAFLRGFTPCAGDHACASRALTTGAYVDGAPCVAHVTEADRSALSVDLTWLDARGEPDDAATWLREFLSLDDDLTPLYEAAADDPPFQRVVDDLYGYHHVRFTTPFEAACWAALSQRTPMRVATRLKRALVDSCGRIVDIDVDGDGDELLLFPTPRLVCEHESAVCEALGNERKSRTVLAAAEAFAGEDLAALDDGPLRDRLASVWGFGEWSSEFVALRGFGRLSDLPRTERRLRRAVALRYDLDAAEATDADLDRLSARYAPVAGYWAHYLRVWTDRRRVAE